ncbi:MAG: dephospho-CoA kinase [Lachnoclostridium sp.]|jgi:dephospho-CoA kinase|nr:dephospho-CoA kinase [Lachnoclostridium sp.]
MVIGVTGGIGSGKSTLVNLMRKKYNAYVLSLDDFGKEALTAGNPCYQRIIQVFGNSVLDDEENIDRNRLADIVFDQHDKLKALNDIIHPYVWKRVESELHHYLDEDMVVIESAILIEAGYAEICDEVWGVFSQKQLRMRRLKESRNHSEERISAIMRNQMSYEELIKHCDHMIQNNGSFADLESQLQKLLVME